MEKSSQKKRRSSPLIVESAAETNGTRAAKNDSGATDSTQKVLGNFVESAQKTATRKNTIERTTEEEKKRIERVSNATNPTSRTATKKEGKVQMDIDSDDGNETAARSTSHRAEQAHAKRETDASDEAERRRGEEEEEEVDDHGFKR